MSTKYLLPCRCGRQIVVETREAGQTSSCPCGQSLLIPTMLEMSRLEPAPAETHPAAEQLSWRWENGLLLLGVAIVAVAVVLGAIVFHNRPIAPIDTLDPEAIQRSAHNLSLLQTWHFWGLMKQGLDRRTDQIFMARLTEYHVFESTFAVIGLIGVALIGVGVGMARKRSGASTASQQRPPNGPGGSP